MLPAVTGRLATSVRVGMGTSLGALAMLHAQLRYPDAFDALFLQSGSFFWPRFDAHEQRFPYYRRITRFVAEVHGGGLPAAPVPVVLTCGAIEENVENNRLMTRPCARHGYPAALHEVPDMHNYTAWRDAFDPYLTGLLAAGEPVNREVAELWSDAIGAAGHRHPVRPLGARRCWSSRPSRAGPGTSRATA